MRKFPILMAIFAAPAALAAYSHVSDFNGRYALACDAASLTLHASLDGEIDGVTQSASGAWTVDLACEGVSDADAALVADEAEDLCLGLGLNAEYCVDFGEETALALSEINEDLLEELIPEQLQFTVTNTRSWLYRTLKIYPMRGVHTFADGDVSTLTYFVSDGESTRGDIWTAALALPGVAPLGPLGCMSVASGTVDGNIDHNAGYQLTADYVRDQTIACGTSVNGDWVAATLGLTLDAKITGERL